MPSPKKSVSPPAPFSKRLKNPSASVKIPSYESLSFSVTMDASLKNNRIGDLGFETNGPPRFVSILAQGCSYFIGLSHDEAEIFSQSMFARKFDVSPDEKVLVDYAWSAIQDVIARLPFDDPLSKAIGKISRLHDEFPLVDQFADDED